MTLLEQTIRELIQRNITFVCKPDSSGGAVIRNPSLQEAFRISFLNHNCVAIIVDGENCKSLFIKTIDDVIKYSKPFIDAN